MSNYTTEVRYICETNANLTSSTGYNSIDNILTEAAPKIFNFNFPIFDETYRLTLEKKILRHYYTREICEETVGLWKLRLEDRMNMIMPYYNKLYDTTLYKFNPLYDTDTYTSSSKEHEGNIEDNTFANKSGTAKDNYTKNTEEIGENKVDRNAYSETNTDNNSSAYESNKIKTGSNENSGGYMDTTNSQSTNSHSASDIVKNENAKNETINLFSDTPQGGIHGINGTAGGNGNTVGDLYYLSNAGKQDTNDMNNSISQAEADSNSDTSDSGDSITSNYRNYAEEVENDRNYGNMNDTHTDKIDNSSENANRSTNVSSTHLGGRDYSENTGSFGTQAINNTESYVAHVFGKSPGTSYSKLIEEFRKTLLNIDKLIIDELSDLFFGLWA